MHRRGKVYECTRPEKHKLAGRTGQHTLSMPKRLVGQLRALTRERPRGPFPLVDPPSMSSSSHRRRMMAKEGLSRVVAVYPSSDSRHFFGYSNSRNLCQQRDYRAARKVCPGLPGESSGARVHCDHDPNRPGMVASLLVVVLDCSSAWAGGWCKRALLRTAIGVGALLTDQGALRRRRASDSG